MKRRDKGFTIVELLIVITIIGVLAVLVIISYNNIQIRAKNTQRIVAAKEWQKLLNAYINQEGKYPLSAGAACLGDGYPTDWDANPDQDCHRKGLIRHVSVGLNTELKKIAAKLPDFPKDPVVLTGGDLGLGLSYQIGTVDGDTNRLMINFWLDGLNQSCGFSVLNSSGNSTTTAYTNGSYNGATLCTFTTHSL